MSAAALARDLLLPRALLRPEMLLLRLELAGGLFHDVGLEAQAQSLDILELVPDHLFHSLGAEKERRH